MAWSQKFRKSEISLDTEIQGDKNAISSFNNSICFEMLQLKFQTTLLVTDKFSAHGTTRAEISNLEISFPPNCHLALGNLPMPSVDVIKWRGVAYHGIKNVTIEMIKISTGFLFVLIVQGKPTLGNTKSSPGPNADRYGHNWFSKS